MTTAMAPKSKRSPSPTTKRRALLLRQANARAATRLASMTRFNSLVRQVAMAVRRNAVPAHLKPIKISAKRK